MCRSRGLIGSVAFALVALLASSCGGAAEHQIVLGAARGLTATAAAEPAIVEAESPGRAAAVQAGQARRTGGDSGDLRRPDGTPYGTGQPFRSSIPVPDHLVFVLVVGSDARPGQSVTRTNADSIHLLAVNPKTRQGTIVGFPRDAYVDIPGKGRNKINAALAMGGPQLLAETVRNVSGLPVQYWVVTGFSGIAKIVDELGGVDINVERRMNDKNSGARFEPGWHHFGGTEVLAFSRNRHDVPNGDFGRSHNHGKVMLAALTKMRSEVGDESGIRRWAGVLMRSATLDLGMSELVALGALARRIDPGALSNIVLPGKVGTTSGGASVVYLTKGAEDLFLDLRADAVVGGASTPVADDSTTTTSAPEETTTTTSAAHEAEQPVSTG